MKRAWWIVALRADKYGGHSVETFFCTMSDKAWLSFCAFKIIRQINKYSDARLWSADRSRWMLSSSAVAESCIFRLSGRSTWVVITESVFRSRTIATLSSATSLTSRMVLCAWLLCLQDLILSYLVNHQVCGKASASPWSITWNLLSVTIVHPVRWTDSVSPW